jgi:chemotaxis protein CheC
MEATAEQLDALQELINIGVGQAASLLNEMVDSYIHLSIPIVKVLTTVEAYQELVTQYHQECLASVKLSFTGSFSGSAGLIFPTNSASTLVAVLTGEQLDSAELNELKIGTLSEVGNIVINGVIGSLSNVLTEHLNYSLPIYLEDTIENFLFSTYEDKSKILLAQTKFTIENLEIIGEFFLIFYLGTFNALINAIDKKIALI